MSRDRWSPHLSDNSSSSASAPPSESYFSGYADDELTASEDMASAVPSELASGFHGQRAGSPTPSDAGSMYSYSSSAHQLTRDIYGRVLNNVNDFYMFPADVEEHSRHDLQHAMLKLAMDGIFVNADVATRAMTRRDGKTLAALDIGTGSGYWVVDCARMFPEAEVVGLDLVPAYLATEPPPNARFEIDDASLGLTHYRNSFDVINARAICSGFENYRMLLDDVLQVLRPGGTYQMVEGNLRIYDENRRPIPPQQDGDPNILWIVKMAHAAHEAMLALGPGVEAFEKVPGWLREMGSVWEEVGEKDVWTAIGPWPQTNEKDRIVGEMKRQNMLRLASSWRPVLLSYGYFDETVDKWIMKVHEELREIRQRLYVRWHCAWAVKSRSLG